MCGSSPTPSPPTPTPPPSGCTGSCGSPQWKGDDWCDDDNNNCGCEWDGGDCCGDDVKTQYCDECLCLDPSEKDTTTTEAPCKDNWSEKKCQNRKKKGKCGKGKVAKNCQKTCEKC